MYELAWFRIWLQVAELEKRLQQGNSQASGRGMCATGKSARSRRSVHPKCSTPRIDRKTRDADALQPVFLYGDVRLLRPAVDGMRALAKPDKSIYWPERARMWIEGARKIWE